MDGRVALTIMLAFAAAFFYALSNVLEQSEAELVPDEHSLRPSLLLRLARRKRWLLGLASDAGGFVFSAAALGLGAITFVQPLLAMGLLLSLFLGQVINHKSLRGREWMAATVLCCGLALFLYEVSPTGGREVVPTGRWLIAGPLIAGAITLCLVSAHGLTGPPRSALLGAAAGISFATSVMFTKTFVHYLEQGIFAWVGHWQTYAMVVSIIGGFLLVQSAFQAGSLAAAVGAVETSEPIAAVAFGLGLFDEQLLATSILQMVLVLVSALAVLGAILVLAQAEERMVGEPVAATT